MTTAPCPPHRWKLDSPHGTPTVLGRCRCGEVREFWVALPDYTSWLHITDGVYKDAERREAEAEATQATRQG